MRSGRSVPSESLARVRAALALPPRSAWRQLAIEAAWSLPLAALLCAAGGLVEPGWTDRPGQLLRLALVALVAPALGEELLFRAALIPHEPPRAAWVALSVVLFVAWHPLQALSIGPPWASAFLDPWFLLCVAVLGTALARIYAETRSIWPCVLAHWAVVFGWKAFFGGPF